MEKKLLIVINKHMIRACQPYILLRKLLCHLYETLGPIVIMCIYIIMLKTDKQDSTVEFQNTAK